MKINLKRAKKSRIFSLLFIALALFGFYQLVLRPSTKKTPITVNPLKPPPRTLKVEVNKSFTFPALPATGKKKPQEITFTITSAEIKNKIRVKGKEREAQEEKAYLLLRLELDNESTKKLTFTSADFIRLVGEEEKKYSPDFHNGVVVIDPISVRRDLVSFVIPKEQKEFLFLVGELEEEKEKIEIKF